MIYIGINGFGRIARVLIRQILNDKKLNSSLSTALNKNFSWLRKNYTEEDVMELFFDDMINEIPVLDKGKLIEIVFRKDFYPLKLKKGRYSISDLPVIIMAGGKGLRLDPFTRILPKPLIPIGNEPIIKIIMDKFGFYGIKNFYLTLNDKAKMIKAFFHGNNLGYNINFIEEEKPLGTAGSLKYISEIIEGPFFLNNCDIVIKYDYREIYKFFKNNKNDITIVGSVQEYSIPYGVCEIQNGGNLVSINEKPKYELLVNTGLYLIDKSVLELIPNDSNFNMNDLINKAMEKKLKVGVFPVSEKSWIDIGQWNLYNKTIDELVKNE